MSNRRRTLIIILTACMCLLWPCACQNGGVDDDDTGGVPPGDDDTTGDDDDTQDDDSTGDDDIQADSFTPWITVETGVGVGDGGAAVVYAFTVVDAAQQTLCSHELSFDAAVTQGPSQGVDLYAGCDEVITFTTLTGESGDCPNGFVDEFIHGGDPVQEWRWTAYGHPLCVVSCDGVAADETLASTFLGEDLWGLGADGTLGEYCTVAGPAAAGAYSTGPVEGVWLIAGEEGSLDVHGDYAYLVPEDTSNVATWMFGGLLMAGETNAAEPVPGLDGSYITLPGWVMPL